MTEATKLAALAAFAAVAIPLSAAAQQDLNQEQGLYAGGTLGINNDSESTWRLFGGYQVNRNFAAELGYHDLGQHNIGGAPLDSTAWELVGVGRVPFGDRFAGYGKLGAYRSKSHGGGFDEKQNDLTFGAGLEYSLSSSLGIRGEWQRYRDIGGGAIGQTADIDVYSIGAVYRFQ